MDLLNKDEVKKEISKSEKESRERISKYQIQEADLIKNINALYDKFESEKKRIDNELFLIENNPALKVKKSILQSEVEDLERRKVKALEPITAQKKEIEERISEEKQILSKIESEKLKIKESEEKLKERLEKVIEREELVDEIHENLDRRESGIKSAEEEIKQQTEKLGKEWVKYNQTVYEKNAELERREKEVEIGKKANESIRVELNRVAKQQAEDKRAIKDGYESLARAREEILGRKE